MLNLPFNLKRGTLGEFLPAQARVLFDPFTKTAGWNEEQNSLEGTVTGGVVQWLQSARRRIKMVSPYFIPSDASIESLAYAKRNSLDVTLVTNSLASTDEPFVYFAYWSQVKALLDAGVRIEELSPTLSVKRHRLEVFGQRQGPYT